MIDGNNATSKHAATSRKDTDSKITCDCKSPLLLGVAGHRDLRKKDMPAIEREVRAVFTELRQKYPHTPLALISPLAAGADRVVASIALKEGASLIVPLSWPVGVYDEQLHRTGDREGFDELVAMADRTIPLSLMDGITEDDIRTSDIAREGQYSQVGAYVARHSQILIAVWDGVKKKDSGTARVVAWHGGGERAPYAPAVGRLDELENGPVHHIKSSRSDMATPVERTIKYSKGHDNNTSAAAAFDSICRHIDEYNADVSQANESFKQQVKKSKDWLFSEDKRGMLPDEIAGLFRRYACADAAAMQLQKTTYATLKGVFVLVAMAVICFEVYAHLLVDYWPLLALYLGLLLASVGWYAWSARSSMQAK